MPDIFTDGTDASAGLLTQTLESMRATGQAVLDDLEAARTDTLFRFQQGLSAMNSRRQRSARVLSPDVACRFVVTDFLDIDQRYTSATVRADSQAVTLRERAHSAEAVVRSIKFTSDRGTVESFSGMYRVYSEDGSTPTGTFDIELADPRDISLVVFDIVTLPSDPAITVSASVNGLEQLAARSVSRNGYRVNAWLEPRSVRYLRIQIAPTHPDTIGGNTFTFGLTSVDCFSVDFHLYSELVTRHVAFEPVTEQLRFRTDDPNLAYYISFDGGQPKAVKAGDVVSIPGVETESYDLVINTDWKLHPVGFAAPLELEEDLYPSSLKLIDVSTGDNVRLAWGLDPAGYPGLITNQYVAIHNRGLELCPKLDASYVQESGRTFRLTYARGPASVTAQLRVQLLTRDRSETPVFRGAYFEHIY